jgi:aldose 1-epimerase
VSLYTLSSDSITVRVTDYGGILVSLLVPDREGKVADVITGYDSLEKYVADFMHFGSIIGRFAGRIAHGEFALGGQDVRVTTNFGKHHLHGGAQGFDKKLWKAYTTATEGIVSLVLTCTSPDGEEGFPGTVEAAAVYTLSPDGTLRLSLSAKSDAPTVVNMTQHAYFNLCGADAGKDVTGHQLQIKAGRYAVTDDDLIPTGEMRPVEGTPLDLRQPAPIGPRLSSDHEAIRQAGGYDHSWELEPFSSMPDAFSARLHDPESGRTLTLWTVAPCLQVFTVNFSGDGHPGRGGGRYRGRAAICLEPQHFPDSPNRPEFPSVVLKPGGEYRNEIVYRFSTD